MTTTFEGGCLCGAVRYQSTADAVGGGHCHCLDCRKSSRTGHCSHMVVPKEAVTVAGELKSYERPTDSGNVVNRMFCPNCGAPVYSLNSSMPEMIFIRASSLNDPELFEPKMVVFTSRAPSWDHIDPDLPAFATMPDV